MEDNNIKEVAWWLLLSILAGETTFLCTFSGVLNSDVVIGNAGGWWWSIPGEISAMARSQVSYYNMYLEPNHAAAWRLMKSRHGQRKQQNS